MRACSATALAAQPTADLAQAGGPLPPVAAPADPLVPAAGSGWRGWAASAGFAVRRFGLALLPVAVLAALPTHFFVGRVDDTVVAAPALSDLAGGFGLLLLPLMWLAYFAVIALPQVIGLAGVLATALPGAAEGRVPAPGRVWRLAAYRLRFLWLWSAAFGVVAQALPVLLTTDRLGPGVAAPLAVLLVMVSAAVLTFTGMLGCVAMIERGHGPRRAVHLFSAAPAGPLVVASLAVATLPHLGEAVAGPIGSTVAAVVAILLWAVAALVTYCQARAAEGPVTSASLLAELELVESD